MEASLIGGVILALIGVIAEIIGRVVAGGLGSDREVVGHISEIQDLRKSAVEVRSKIEAHHQESASAQLAMAEVRVKAKAAERRVALVRPYHRLVFENGAPGQGQRFDASVFNLKAGVEDFKTEPKKIINPIYLKEVQVVIWAKSEDAAQKKLDSLFPKFEGFEVTFHGAVFHTV